MMFKENVEYVIGINFFCSGILSKVMVFDVEK